VDERREAAEPQSDSITDQDRELAELFVPGAKVEALDKAYPSWG